MKNSLLLVGDHVDMDFWNQHSSWWPKAGNGSNVGDDAYSGEFGKYRISGDADISKLLGELTNDPIKISGIDATVMSDYLDKIMFPI